MLSPPLLEGDFGGPPGTGRGPRFHLILTPTELQISGGPPGAGGGTWGLRLADVVGSHTLRAPSLPEAAFFAVYAYPLRGRGGPGGRRRRCAPTFRVDDAPHYEENRVTAERWARTLSCLVRGLPLPPPGALPPELRRRRLLLLLNPFGGRGRALRWCQSHVLPVLGEADIAYNLVQTERPNHARELVATLSLEQWDGIVTASGDGLLFEVVNGLLERQDWAEALRTPLGILPCGSGNAMAAAINHLAGLSPALGLGLLQNLALVLCRASPSPLDLMSVTTASGGRVFSFLSVAWGLVADVDIESERLRRLGPARFALGAAARLLALHTYRGRLSYLPAVPRSATATDGATDGATAATATTLPRAISDLGICLGSSSGDGTPEGGGGNWGDLLGGGHNGGVGVNQEFGINQEVGGDQEVGVNEEFGVNQEVGVNQEIGVSQEVGVNQEFGGDQEFGINQEVGGDREFGVDKEFGVNQEVGVNHEVGVNQEVGVDQEFGVSHEVGVNQEFGGDQEFGINQEVGVNQEVGDDQEFGVDEEFGVNQGVGGDFGKNQGFGDHTSFGVTEGLGDTPRLKATMVHGGTIRNGGASEGGTGVSRGGDTEGCGIISDLHGDTKHHGDILRDGDTKNHGDTSSHGSSQLHDATSSDEATKTHGVTSRDGVTKTHGVTSSDGATRNHDATSSHGSSELHDATSSDGPTMTHDATSSDGPTMTHGVTSSDGPTKTHSVTSSDESTKNHDATSSHGSSKLHDATSSNGATTTHGAPSKAGSSSIPRPGGPVDDLLVPLGQPLPPDWVTLEGDFVLVVALSQSHLGAELLVAPQARPNDGLIQLCWVPGGVSRAALLRALVAMTRGTAGDGPGPPLTRVPARAFRLEPLSPRGTMTVDGERVEYGPIQGQIHRGLARIFTAVGQ